MKQREDPAGGVAAARSPAAAAPEAEFRWPEDRPGEIRAAAARHAPRAPRGVRAAGAAVGASLATAVYLLPTPAGLDPAGQAAASVFLLATTLWISGLLPVGVTGLLAVALLVLLGGMSAADAYAAFGNSAVFFILSVFILAAAVIHTGLSKRLALLFLGRFRRSGRTLAAGIMVTAAFLTAWMPAQATAAMLFPIVLEIARAMRLRPAESAYGKVLFLSLAWGAMVGSNASILGSTRAPLALGLLGGSFGRTITFAEWAAAAAPVVLLGLGAGVLILRFGFPAEAVDAGAARRVIENGVAELGPFGPRQRRVATVVAVTIAAWVGFAGRLDFAAVGLLGAVAVFAVGAVRWSDLDGYVNWGIVLMYGGAIALGVAIDRSGAARWLVDGVLPAGGLPPFAALASLAVLTLVLSEVMSNAAAVAVTLPVGFSLAEQLHVEPTAMVFAACLGGGLAFTLPISSAPNTISFASGYVRMRDMLVVGSVMTGVQLLILLLVARFYWRALGLW